MLSHYEVNQITGEKFLRLTMREWKTSYDPEIDEDATLDDLIDQINAMGKPKDQLH